MPRPEKIGQSDCVGINAFQIPPQGYLQAEMSETLPDERSDVAEDLCLDNKRDISEL